MEMNLNNREKKEMTYLICLGTFACHLGREINKMGIENMHVWLMDGWQDSEGCGTEVEYAMETGKEVLYDPEDFRT